MTTFTAGTDHYGRAIMLCDDALAVSMLAFASRQGWREIADMAYGYSMDYAPGTVIHSLCVALWEAQQAAGLGYVGALYHPSARNLTEHNTEAFVADRAAGRVVCMMPGFGYSDPATSPVRFAG